MARGRNSVHENEVAFRAASDPVDRNTADYADQQQQRGENKGGDNTASAAMSQGIHHADLNILPKVMSIKLSCSYFVGCDSNSYVLFFFFFLLCS